MCFPKPKGHASRHNTAVSNLKEIVKDKPELGMRALYLLMGVSTLVPRDIEMLLIWRWIDDLQLDTQQKAELLLGVKHDIPFAPGVRLTDELYGTRILQRIPIKRAY